MVKRGTEGQMTCTLGYWEDYDREMVSPKYSQCQQCKYSHIIWSYLHSCPGINRHSHSCYNTICMDKAICAPGKSKLQTTQSTATVVGLFNNILTTAAIEIN